MIGAEEHITGNKWTPEQNAEFKKLCGTFQATPSNHNQASSTTPPAAPRFVRPRAYSPSDRNRPCHISGPSPSFSAIVASYGRRFGTSPYRGPSAPIAASPAPTTSAATRATRGSEPSVPGAYAPTTPPDQEFFTRGPPTFPAGHNHYRVPDKLRQAWYTAGSRADQGQKK
ncbi:hypothetical protein MMC34_003782 [Xylographa carneopallida]|nr:hypothetical protein [Xylographa carneopallida]